MVNVKIGIITGTGLGAEFNTFCDSNVEMITTPFGQPSDGLRKGIVEGVPIVLLRRHGATHSINPSNINYRANIWALKSVGCTHVLALTACGGLQEHTKPGDLVILDQFFDNTHRRDKTFYDGHPQSPKGVLHIPMNEPFCNKTRQILIKCIKKLGGRVHESGTVITIEGPRFSTKFESKYWNKMGASVINMTTVPEVILAKELGLCYASVALVTDYDSWHDEHESVDVTMVTAVMKSNNELMRKVLLEAIKMISVEHWVETFRKNQELIESCIVG